MGLNKNIKQFIKFKLIFYFPLLFLFIFFSLHFASNFQEPDITLILELIA